MCNTVESHKGQDSDSINHIGVPDSVNDTKTPRDLTWVVFNKYSTTTCPPFANEMSEYTTTFEFHAVTTTADGLVLAPFHVTISGLKC